MKTGICKLCQNERPLLNKSHIIPEFMYKSLFDEGHRLNKFAPAELIEGKGRISKLPTGEYEDGLLCENCDGVLINGYETYARKALYGKVETDSDLPECINYKTDGGVKFTRCSNVHYKEFKLFLLSILWRASISKRDFFKEVNLGIYENIIRQMILNGDPKESDVFPILMLTWISDKSLPTDLIGQPGINRIEKGVRYILPIGGITYIFHISPTSLVKEYRKFIVSSNNEISLLHMPEGKSMELLLKYSGTKI